jgi:hypothetical protein
MAPTDQEPYLLKAVDLRLAVAFTLEVKLELRTFEMVFIKAILNVNDFLHVRLNVDMRSGYFRFEGRDDESAQIS